MCWSESGCRDRVPEGQKCPGGHREPACLSSGLGEDAPSLHQKPDRQGPTWRQVHSNFLEQHSDTHMQYTVIEIHTHRQTGTHTHRHRQATTHTHTQRQAGRQASTHTHAQRQAGRQAHTHTPSCLTCHTLTVQLA